MKYKGIFEIIPKQNGKVAYNKNWSMRIVPIALEKYYINNIPIEQTIKNHRDIYDFCIAEKFPKPWYGEFNYLENSEKKQHIFKKNIRYYISTNGSYLWKVNKDDKRRIQLNVGFAITPFNKYQQKDNYNINYNFYISETNKIINSINDGQLKLY